METRWYNISIDPKSKVDELLEKPNKHGKYARRDELEPILRKLVRENKEYDKLIELVTYNIETFRSQFSKNGNEGMIYNCDSLLSKLKSY